MRKTISFNRDWYFSNDEHMDEVKYDLSLFEKIELPHNPVEIPFNYFDEKMMWGTFNYVHHIEITPDMVNQACFLHFEGVAHRADVYIEGKHILRHDGGYTPFDVDLSMYCERSQTLTMFIKVDTREHAEIPPFGGVVDYLGYGGIYREVYLNICDPAHIKQVYIEQYGKPNFKIHVKTSIENGDLNIDIINKNQEVVQTVTQNITSETTIIPITLSEVDLWDLESPSLYRAVIHYTLREYQDMMTTTFGIREAIFKRDGFYLNQKKIKLRGLNRHQSYPYVGYAMPKNAQIDDADLLKYELGLNIVRTSHYPQSRHFLDRCDEIGLLVLEELPGWQHVGNQAWKDLALDFLDAMIERDRNHPSIILWGVRINESADDDAFYQMTNAHAMALDPTRQRGGIRNFAKSHLLEDVYTYNDFSNPRKNKAIERKDKIAGDVPYLITEFNGHMFPTKRYDDEKHRVEHLKRHLNVLNDVSNETNGIAGAMGWVFADYNTHQEFGSGDKVCYHGVLDMYRIPKIAALAYQCEQDQYPILEVTSTMNMGDHPVGHLGEIYVMTNLDYVKVYKNDTYIKTFYPNQKQYPHLKHPPVIVDDFIGETLMKNEHMSYRDAEKTKKVLYAVTRYGTHLPLRYQLTMLYIIKKYKKTYDDAVKLFYTYMTGWGTKHHVYRFEGYKNDELIKVITKEPVQTTEIILETQPRDLIIEDSYDVKRYVIKKVDQHKELLVYANDVVNIEISGEIELIGPSKLALSGGTVAFWIKSKSKGIGTIIITCDQTTLIEEVNVL